MFSIDVRNKLQSALDYYAPPDAHEEWSKCVIALKAGGVDRETARQWSERGANYSERAFNDTWRSAKPDGNITLDWFFAQAYKAGWRYNRQAGTALPQKSGSITPQVQANLEQEKAQEKRESASEQMRDIIERNTSPEDVNQAIPYVESRGFSPDTALKWSISLVSDKLFIPYPAENFCIIRDLNTAPNGEKTKGKPKYRPAVAGLGYPLFNIPALNSGESVVYITEGAFDAISICETGAQAVATPFTSKLIDAIKKNGTTAEYFIIVPDNDTTGMEKAEKHLKALDALGMKAEICPLPAGYHDCNDCLKRNYAEFVKWRIQTTENAPKVFQELEVQRIADYKQTAGLASIYQSIKDHWLKEGDRPEPTGFELLDKQLDGGLYSGIYTLGAGTGYGKTTLALQIACNMAKAGRDVLYFALEMSTAELVSKILSCLTKQVAGEWNLPLTTACYSRTITNKASRELHMKYSKAREVLIEAETRFTPIAEHLYITDDSAKVSTVDIAERVKRHIDTCKTKPVVFVDYIQILTPLSDRLTDKQATDANIVALKDISRKNDIPVFLISSFNRESYSKEVGLTAFKESGAIEYASDCIFGLQAQGMKSGEDAKEIKENNQLNRQTLEQDERKVELKILKNRFGKLVNIQFLYFAPFNHFSECTYSNPQEGYRSAYNTLANKYIRDKVSALIEEQGNNVTIEDVAHALAVSKSSATKKLHDAGVETKGERITAILSLEDFEQKLFNRRKAEQATRQIF